MAWSQYDGEIIKKQAVRACSRRSFLLLATGLAGSVLNGRGLRAGTRQLGQTPQAPGPRVIYRLSLRGRNGSQAAKDFNANMRFASRQAVYRAHPGDNSRIVPLVVSQEEYQRLFVSRRSPIADLRNLDGIVQLPFKRGDVNSSGDVDISDPISLLGYLFSGRAPAPSCPDAADANDDGSLDASDSISMLQWLFRDGREPPAPGPRRCGLDRTLTNPPLPPCAPGPGSCSP